VEQGILPAPLLPGMLDFYNNYKTAVLGSGVPGADERRVASVMGAIADRRVRAERYASVTDRKHVHDPSDDACTAVTYAETGKVVRNQAVVHTVGGACVPQRGTIGQQQM